MRLCSDVQYLVGTYTMGAFQPPSKNNTIYLCVLTNPSFARMQLYMSEIFPTRIREGGIAVGAATQWLFGFTLSQITPAAVNNLGYKAFLMFCCFNWALVLYTWFFIKETKGLSLEEMEICKFLSAPHIYKAILARKMKLMSRANLFFLLSPKNSVQRKTHPN